VEKIFILSFGLGTKHEQTKVDFERETSCFLSIPSQIKMLKSSKNLSRCAEYFLIFENFYAVVD
jgi:hypothetical protein